MLGTSAGYSLNRVSLNGRTNRLGVPSFIQSYFRTRITTESGCTNQPILFEVDTYSTISTIDWDFGDGNISSGISPKNTYNLAGEYNVKAKVVLSNGSTIEVSKGINVHKLPSLKNDTELEQCDTDFDGLSTFNLNNINEIISSNSDNEDFLLYRNINDAILNENKIENPDDFKNSIPNKEVFVRVINQNNCYDISSFF
jgi:hypothetical protein